MESTELPRIYGWNPDRGFGFIDTPQGKAFVHATKVKLWGSKIKRGANLTGKQLRVLKTQMGPKGLQVLESQLENVGLLWPMLID